MNLNTIQKGMVLVNLFSSFVIASPTEREAMIEVIEEKKGAVAGEARSLYEAILLEGMEKGMEKGLEKSVRNMHDKNFPVEEIADILDLLPAKVREILG